MAVDYTTLFTRIGKCVKAVNSLLALQPTVLGYGDAILDEYEDDRDLVLNTQTQFNSFTSQIASWEKTIKTIVDTTLADIAAELNCASTDPTTVLTALAAQMIIDEETINACTVGAPTATPATTNSGTGSLTLSTSRYDGVTNEAVLQESLDVTVNLDSYGGATAGAERWLVVGEPKIDAYLYGNGTRGSGSTTSLVTIDGGGNNWVQNPGFETFTSTHVPASWSVNTAGTGCVSQETSVIHAGSGALKLNPDGTAGIVTLTQTITGRAKPRSVFTMGAWLRKGGTVSAGGTLAIGLSGTGIAGVNLFSGDPATLGTSFALSSTFSAFTNVVPGSLTLTISLTGATNSGAAAIIYIDDVVVGLPTLFNGVYYAAFRGSTPWTFGDKIVVATTNNFGGVFQTFFARFYGMTLPSSGSPTIADSLAT